MNNDDRSVGSIASKAASVTFDSACSNVMPLKRH